jgi:signal transduction histidine kinase
VFHANRSKLNSTWLGPVSETYSISPAGSAPYPFQDNAATIYTIANTGAMLLFGQKRSRVNAALTAEPRCAADFSSRRDTPRPSSFGIEFLTLITTPEGVAVAIVELGPADASYLATFGGVLRHELNNPLTGILRNAELLLAETSRQRSTQFSEGKLKRLETIAALAASTRETVRGLSQACEARSEQVRSA